MAILQDEASTACIRSTGSVGSSRAEKLFLILKKKKVEYQPRPAHRERNRAQILFCGGGEGGEEGCGGERGEEGGHL